MQNKSEAKETKSKLKLLEAQNHTKNLYHAIEIQNFFYYIEKYFISFPQCG